jgi:hypothetical protein
MIFVDCSYERGVSPQSHCCNQRELFANLTFSGAVYPGIASTASFFLNGTEPAFGSLFQIGWAYAMGIAFAIITCASTSGGHFNPVSIVFSLLWPKQNFPVWKTLTDSVSYRL